MKVPVSAGGAVLIFLILMPGGIVRRNAVRIIKIIFNGYGHQTPHSDAPVIDVRIVVYGVSGDCRSITLFI
jgi:hypothetical protein